MKKYFIAIACAAIALVSCNKENVQNSSPVRTLRVGLEVPGTDNEELKSVLEGTNVVFAAGDAISVFDGVSNNKFTTTEGGAVATFSGTAADAGQYLVLSPYVETATLASPSVVRITIPDVQVATPGGVDPNALLSAGIATADGAVTLYNAVGLVQIVVPAGLQVKNIQLGGGYGSDTIIAGDFDFNAASQTLAFTSGGSTSTVITLVPPQGESLIAPGTYYIGIRPKTVYDNGFTVAYVDADNVLHKRQSRNKPDIKRSHILPMGQLSESAFTAVTGRSTLRYADSAPQFTGLLKQLAGGSGTFNETDNVIKKIVFKAHTLYSQSYKAGSNVISNGPNSDIQIHAYIIGDVAYVCTEAPIITLYSNSANLFRDFAALEEVVFDDVNTMANASFSYMFRNCVNLKNVDFGNADFSKVTDFSFMFVTNKLENVNFGKTATTSATTMQSMFSQALNLRNLHLGPNFTLAANTTGMFNGTASVTTTILDEEGHGLQCKFYSSQVVWDALNVDLNENGVNPTTLFNKNRFYFIPAE